MKSENEIKRIISEYTYVSRPILLLTGAFVLFYITWWLNLNNMGNPVLYGLLLIGEIYHVWQAFGYIYTVWDQKPIEQKLPTQFPFVDIFITVCGEPVNIVEKTLRAALAMDYPNFNVFILNDGFVAKKDNWRDIDDLAKRYGATHITRRKPGGAKAGNINNALKYTNAPFFAVFDADHIPEKEFLTKTMGYFEDEKMAIVQTPQFYENKDQNYLTEAAWEQQELFFGAICRGKNRMNATFWCGTNAVIRKEALAEVGGVPENNIAEDFLASLLIHDKGWKSVYVAEVLAKGLAPHELQSYVNQQFRWARGSLEIIFKYNPLFRKGLSWAQKLQYLYSSSYYLNGLIVLIDALIPLVVLFSGITPVNVNSTDFLIFFFPFIISTIYVLSLSTNHSITFKAIQLSISSSFVFIQALIATLFGLNSQFKVTDKEAKSGNYIKLATPHLTYMLLGIYAGYHAISKYGMIPSVMTNISWITFNMVFFFGFVNAAYPWGLLLDKAKAIAYIPQTVYNALAKSYVGIFVGEES